MTHPPTDDAPGIDIDDKGHEQPALPSSDVGEVRYPQLIGTAGVELPVDPVLRAWRRCVWRGGTDAFATACACQPEPAHEALDRAAGHPYAFTVHLLPALVGAIDLPVGMPDPLDPGDQGLVTLGTGAMKLWTALESCMQAVTRWGDLQGPADRLDPERVAVAVHEIDQDLSRRSSSAWAKNALASLGISLARRSSLTSRSSAFT